MKNQINSLNLISHLSSNQPNNCFKRDVRKSYSNAYMYIIIILSNPLYLKIFNVEIIIIKI